jgi:Ca2+-binding EF-hand superfamily protein
MIVGYVEYFVPVGHEGEQLSDDAGRQSGLAGDREQLLFTTLDANDDDRLSRDEFRKLSENSRLKQFGAELIDGFFTTLDKDGDGVQTLEEFRELRNSFRKKR